MADNSTNPYEQKTDAELLFFVQNPSYYHNDLVASAARELRRRGVNIGPLPTDPNAPAYHHSPDAAETPASGAGRIIGLVMALLLVLGGGYFFYQQSLKQKAQIAEAKAAAKARQTDEALELKSVESEPLPNYDAAVERCLQQQLAKVPASEKAKPQELKQYETLVRHFWAAETVTEYVLEQARKPNPSPLLVGKVATARDAWRPWSQSMRYSFKFGPVMTDHLDRMSRVARQQTEGLADLPAMLQSNGPPLETPEARQREADVQNLLAGLVPASPVTGKPYKASTRTIHL